MKIAISSGHSTKCQGAIGYINEVAEATRVVDKVAELLNAAGHPTEKFHDTISDDSSENLNRIVDWHNGKTRDLDVSVHFNAYQTTSGPMGTEVLYVSNSGLDKAEEVVDAIAASSGLINRGPKYRNDLFFLNNTEMPAILVETCFVDSQADVNIYGRSFDVICGAIAEAIAGEAAQIPIPLPPNEEDQEVIDIAMESAIAQYNWRDRGKAPTGYIQGFALTWAQIVRRWQAGEAAVLEMGVANTHDDNLDALSWYNSNFVALGMSNETSSLDTLRHLFVLLMGLGMRESSGKHCCGRDQSASNTDANTCEAGLYQTSYNAHSCSEHFDVLMAKYEQGDVYADYVEEFAIGVSCSAADWQCYGSGKGYDFQHLCKNSPAFAVESCALVLRNLRQHYGPINRKEAELRTEADVMLGDVQRAVIDSESAEEQVPEVEVTIKTKGVVKVVVKQVEG